MAGGFHLRVIRTDAYRGVADRMAGVRAGDAAALDALLAAMRAALDAPAFQARNAGRLDALTATIARWSAEGPRVEAAWEVERDVDHLGETAVLLLTAPDYEHAFGLEDHRGWNFAPFAEDDAGLFVALVDDPWVDKMLGPIWYENPEWPTETMRTAAPAIALYPRDWLPGYAEALAAHRPSGPRAAWQAPLLARHRDLAARALADRALALSVLSTPG